MEIMFPKTSDPKKVLSIGRSGAICTAGVYLLKTNSSLDIHPITSKMGVSMGCVALPLDSKTLYAVAIAISDQAEKLEKKEKLAADVVAVEKMCQGKISCMMDTNELIAFCEKHEGMVVKAARKQSISVERHLVQFKDGKFTDRLEDGKLLNDSALKFRICHITGEHPLPKQWEVTG